MTQMGHEHGKSTNRLLLILSLALMFAVSSSDENRKDNVQVSAKNVTELFSPSDLGDKIKDLLDKRSGRPGDTTTRRPNDPNFEKAFETLFTELSSIADSMTDDFEFDLKLYGLVVSHPSQNNVHAKRCLNNGTQFKQFLSHVHTLLEDLRQGDQDDLTTSADIDDSSDVHDNDTSTGQDDNLDSNDKSVDRDSREYINNSTNDSRDSDSTTDSPDSKLDNDDDSNNNSTNDSRDNDSKDKDRQTDSPDSKLDNDDDSNNNSTNDSRDNDSKDKDRQTDSPDSKLDNDDDSNNNSTNDSRDNDRTTDSPDSKLDNDDNSNNNSTNDSRDNDRTTDSPDSKLDNDDDSNNNSTNDSRDNDSKDKDRTTDSPDSKLDNDDDSSNNSTNDSRDNDSKDKDRQTDSPDSKLDNDDDSNNNSTNDSRDNDRTTDSPDSKLDNDDDSNNNSTNDSRDNDRTTDSPDSKLDNDDDSNNNSTNDSRDNDSKDKDRTTDSPDSKLDNDDDSSNNSTNDSRDNDSTTHSPDSKLDNDDDSSNNSTNESKDNDSTTDSPDSKVDNDDDSSNNSTNDSKDNDSKHKDRTTDSPDSKLDNDDDSSNNSTNDSSRDSDSIDTDRTTDSPDSKLDSDDDSANSTMKNSTMLGEAAIKDTKLRRRRDQKAKGYNLDEVFGELEMDDMDCLARLFSKEDEQFLCRRFVHRAPVIYSKIVSAGIDCRDYLQDDDSKEDDSDDVTRDKDDTSQETTNVTASTVDVSDDTSEGRPANTSRNVSGEETQDSDELNDKTKDVDGDGNSEDGDGDINNNENGSRPQHLDVFHQLAILKLFKEKDSAERSDDDVKRVLRLAPDVVDDDFLEELPEELFKLNLHSLGRLAVGQRGNPSVRYMFRKRLQELGFGKLTTDDIHQIGPGLLSFPLDKIAELDGRLFLESDFSDLYSSDESVDLDSKEKMHDDDDDDSEDDDVKLAIGHRIKEAIKQEGLQKHQIGRAMRYLHHDLDFVRSIQPDNLLDVLDDIGKIDFDSDDVQSVFYHLAQSSYFPPITKMSGHNLTRIGKIMRGMDVELLALLNKESLEEALDDISDIDFNDLQAHQLLENMGYTSDLTNDENLKTTDIRRLGKLFRGMPVNSIMMIENDVIENSLDDLDDLGLNNAVKITIVEKVRSRDDKISSKFLTLDTFAEVISLDDLDDIDDTDIKHHINISAFIRWRQPQAVLLAHKYKTDSADEHLSLSDLAEMKSVVLGVLPDDLDDMIKTQDDVFNIAEKLKSVQDDLTSSQIDELIENWHELSDLDSKEVIIDETQAIQAAHVLAYLKPELFDKLEFTAAGKMAFLSQVAKMSTHKMSRDHIQFLAKTMLDMLENMDSAESQTKSEDRESLRLRSLGQMALGLTPGQINGFSGTAIIDNLDILRTLVLTKAQAKAVLEKVDDAVENWQCRLDYLVRVGSLLQHLDNPLSDDCDSNYQAELLNSFSSVGKALEKRREMIQKRLDEGFTKENDDATDNAGEKRLVNTMVSMVTQKLNVRKRRAAPSTNGLLTCDVLIRLGKAAMLIDTQALASIPKEEVKRCLPQLGAIGGWSQEALKVLAEKVKSVYPDVSSWSAKTVAAAGSIIAGLSSAEIQLLSGLNRVDILHKLGKHGKLSTEQLKAGFHQWLQLNKKNDTSEMTGSELSSISEFVCGLETIDISKLKDATFKSSLYTIGSSTMCTLEQSHAYLDKALTVYGTQVNQWNSAIVADMGHLLGALSDEQMKMLTAEQIALLPPKTIQMLPKNRITAMTSSQLMVLSTNQANAVMGAHYEALTAEQQRIIYSKASITPTKQDNSSTDSGRVNENGVSKVVHCGLLALITAASVHLLL